MTVPATARQAGSLVARAQLPLPLLASAATATAVVVGLSVARPATEMPMFVAQLVLLVIAAGSAYLLDDSARQVTEVVPQRLWRRRARVVLRGYGVLAVAWAPIVVVLDWRSPSLPLLALTCEVAGLCSLAVAVAAVAARSGESEPGNLVASGLALAFLCVVVVQPVFHLTLIDTAGDGPGREAWWVGLTLLAVAIFLMSSRDRGQSLRRSR